ncbi:GNAT family N-acetyltransferase [Planctomycetales bacterium ZRK34]|nr:GNAT family N-acetyltransferase [Planctomycetales bacterium ZRK34]
MLTIPVLTSEQLILRPFETADVALVSRYAADPAVADRVSRSAIEYQSPEQWIDQQHVNFEEANYLTLAITQRAGGQLLGCITQTHYEADEHAELDYWIAKPYWNRGYATEAGRLMLDYTFDCWQLRRVFACHFATNPASGRVLEKLGFTREGVLRQHYCADNVFEDLVYWGLLRHEWARDRVHRRPV